MCGIIGYIGNKNAGRILLNGLKRMEYRGYDSSGIAVIDGGIEVKKKKGKISELESLIDLSKYDNYFSGIGHTRWATHGEPSDVNSHPHVSRNGKIAVVHNGIIENFSWLRTKLTTKGYKFISQTDSEVIAHLIEYYAEKTGNYLDGLLYALSRLEGTYGLAIINSDFPDRVVAARKGSPLILGIGNDDTLVASDISAIIEHTRKVIYVEDGEVVDITKDGFQTYDIDKNKVDKIVENVDWEINGIEKQGFDYFMLKEIHEQGETIRNAFRGRILSDFGSAKLDGLNLSAEDLKKIKKIIFLACGTSWHAALVGEYLIEEFAGIPVEVEYASEFRYKRPILTENDLVVVISQSGETADTLAAMREAKARGVKVLGITNVVGSAIARESDGGTYIHAGPEIGVASTKAFTSQVTVLILFAILLGRRSLITLENGLKYLKDLEKIPELVGRILENSDHIKKIALKYSGASNFLYLGRGIHFPVALEGALKLKEISYIHAEGYPAAEMKHGPIALIDENMPVVFIATKDEVYYKVLSNMQEVKARGGKIITIATEGDEEVKEFSDDVIYVPESEKITSPLLTVIPLQLLSYYIAVERGCDVDQPRNLAKSVTVE
ncbi:MAG: glutamine--fructose-6-phosphate transaminase (isomerizing) [Spirochaetes bacterium]|nr:glutamine--fructose-6-phosphate transaminase (isomerizing) [Spirochaetota bacterium]